MLTNTEANHMGLRSIHLEQLAAQNSTYPVETEQTPILVISHDYEFLLSTCTDILSMYEGHITECFSVNKENSSLLMKSMEAF